MQDWGWCWKFAATANGLNNVGEHSKMPSPSTELRPVIVILFAALIFVSGVSLGVNRGLLADFVTQAKHLALGGNVRANEARLPEPGFNFTEDIEGSASEENALAHEKLISTATFDFVANIKNSVFARPQYYREEFIRRLITPKSLVNVSHESKDDEQQDIVAEFYGISIKSVFSQSISNGNCLIIFNDGHWRNPFDSAYHNDLRRRSLERGCDVISFSMIGHGLNSGVASFPSIIGQSGGNIVLSAEDATNHASYFSFFDLNNPQLDPLALFLSGHYWIIKSLENRYERIAMIGLSGGGWYTTMLSAIIPSIDTSVSYAGTVPLLFRWTTENFGDYEQIYAPFWRDYDYWHLYFLSIIDNEKNPTRNAFLVYNDNDNCCFSDPSATKLKSVLHELGGVQVLVDRNDDHTINNKLAHGLLFENN